MQDGLYQIDSCRGAGGDRGGDGAPRAGARARAREVGRRARAGASRGSFSIFESEFPSMKGFWDLQLVVRAAVAGRRGSAAAGAARRGALGQQARLGANVQRQGRDLQFRWRFESGGDESTGFGRWSVF